MGKRVAFVVFTLVGTLVLLGLGTWQWQRRAEKREFIARIAEAATRPAKPLGESRLWDRVTLDGQFVPGKTAYVRSSRPAPKPGERDSRGEIPVSGYGVMVISAFRTEFCEGSACRPAEILVNLGFLPTPPTGRIPPISMPEGTVRLTGFLRPGEREGVFPPYNDPAKGTFFFRSTEQIARMLGLSGGSQARHPALAFAASVDLERQTGDKAPPYGLDVPDMIRSIPNNHLEYAITWWSLAATNLAVAAFFLFSRRRDDEAA